MVSYAAFIPIATLMAMMVVTSAPAQETTPLIVVTDGPYDFEFVAVTGDSDLAKTTRRRDVKQEGAMGKTGHAAVYDEPNAPFVVREFPVRGVRPDEAFAKAAHRSVLRAAIVP